MSRFFIPRKDLCGILSPLTKSYTVPSWGFHKKPIACFDLIDYNGGEAAFL